MHSYYSDREKFLTVINFLVFESCVVFLTAHLVRNAARGRIGGSVRNVTVLNTKTLEWKKFHEHNTI
jgi:hypothetical protein